MPSCANTARLACKVALARRPCHCMYIRRCLPPVLFLALPVPIVPFSPSRPLSRRGTGSRVAPGLLFERRSLRRVASPQDSYRFLLSSSSGLPRTRRCGGPSALSVRCTDSSTSSMPTSARSRRTAGRASAARPGVRPKGSLSSTRSPVRGRARFHLVCFCWKEAFTHRSFCCAPCTAAYGSRDRCRLPPTQPTLRGSLPRSVHCYGGTCCPFFFLSFPFMFLFAPLCVCYHCYARSLLLPTEPGARGQPCRSQ